MTQMHPITIDCFKAYDVRGKLGSQLNDDGHGLELIGIDEAHQVIDIASFGEVVRQIALGGWLKVAILSQLLYVT